MTNIWQIHWTKLKLTEIQVLPSNTECKLFGWMTKKNISKSYYAPKTKQKTEENTFCIKKINTLNLNSKNIFLYFLKNNILLIFLVIFNLH